MQFRKLLQLSTSSQPDPYLPPPRTPPHQHHHLLTPLLAVTAASCFILVLFTLLCRRTRKRTSPLSFDNPPHRLSYSLLRRATRSFSSPIGHGGFGTVFSGSLSSKPVAVKLMDHSSSSQQREREFHNELFFSSKLRSVHVITPIGFSSDPKRRRFLLIYPLMQNGNLQDALLRRKSPELFIWNKRFEIALVIAKGLHYLHSFEPPVIHGDIKPSNILLDSDFVAKIGDFGLARLKSEPPRVEVGVLACDSDDEEKKSCQEGKKSGELECGGVVIDDCGSVDSLHIGFVEEGNLGVEQLSPVLPETVEVGMTMASPGFDDGVESEKDVVVGDGKRNENGKWMKSKSLRDWWWKHDNEIGEGKKVKDYVMEWIGREVKSERPNEWEGGETEKLEMKKKEKKKKERLEWWESMDDDNIDGIVRNQKRKSVREWWNEEYCEEIAKKKKNAQKKNKKKKGVESDNGNGDDWRVSDDTLYGDRMKGKSRSRKNNQGSFDWGLDGFSGELWRGRRNSFDSASGEIPKSGGVSSTPSTRGTVCYVAPEYGYGEDASEKCDVYSFGILLLVIISGRRPLQVTGSPLSEFQRANLLSWARHCARNGKLIELVDESVQSMDKEQALLCIKVALVCLLRSPARRPSMKEVVGMLSGDLEPPQLPVEFSPSTPSRFPFKSRKKGQITTTQGITLSN